MLIGGSSVVASLISLICFKQGVVLATLSCCVLGITMIPIMAHGFTVGSLIAEDL